MPNHGFLAAHLRAVGSGESDVGEGGVGAMTGLGGDAEEVRRCFEVGFLLLA